MLRFIRGLIIPISTIFAIQNRLKDIRKRFNAGYGIRTRELLRDRILSPAPLASLANPATI